MGKKKPCLHTHANYEQIRNGKYVVGSYAILGGNDPHFGYGGDREILGATCADCNQLLPLGPSNDAPPEVQIEMRAAELEDTEHWGPGFISVRERWGMEDHADPDSEAEDAPDYMATEGWAAGWLSAEIATHEARADRDATAWAWDISRPLAEQLAKTAADDAAADVLESWSCPALSNECEIRRQCTNKCGRKDPAPTDEARWSKCPTAMCAVVRACFRPLAECKSEAFGVDVPPALLADGDLSTLPVINLDAIEYELTRDAEPDCRDEDGPEVERIMAEMEVNRG